MPNHRKKKNHRHGNNSQHVASKIKHDSKDEDSDENRSSLYEVKISDVLGRYLVASKALKPGEVIIEELPLVIGPPTESEPVCLGCLQKLDSFTCQTRCPRCRWPLCSTDCKGLYMDHGHERMECEILAEKKVADILESYSRENLMAAYEIILQLRCLLLKLTDENKWNCLMEMESHNEIRKDVKWLWCRNQTKVVQRLREEWKIDAFTEEEIHTVCGIIEVNCFEIGPDDGRGRALYRTSFLFAHDCVPNLTHIDNPSTYSMAIRSLRDIKIGDALTVNYGYIFMGTLQRRKRLNMGKFFWCTCKRCADPSELGTYCSALKCSSCVTGLVLPTKPLEQDAVWKCLTCTHTTEADTVSTMLDTLYDELESRDPHDVAGLEQFIKKYGNILGENHYLILSAKYPLCQLYGRAKDFLIDSLSENLLERKKKYCRDILQVIRILEPGLSQTKGIIMYELHVPLLLLAGKYLERGRLSRREFMKCLKEVVSLLEESSKILKMDPGQKQQEMVHGADMALMSLKLQNLL